MTHNKNKLKLLAIIGILLLASIACLGGGNNGGGGGGDADIAATQASLQATQAALNAQPQAAPPTSPPADIPPTDPPAPAVGQAIDWDSAAVGDILYFTDFDDSEEASVWYELLVPSSSTNYTAKLGEGFLYMLAGDENTTVYGFFDGAYYERGQNVYIETGFDNIGQFRNNNISLICRATDSGWYEFSISSSGLWYFWKYDKTNNDYDVLHNGGVPNYDKNITDHFIGLACIDDQFTFYYDGEALRNGTFRDGQYREGQVGISITSFNVTPIEVEFDYFGIEKQ